MPSVKSPLFLSKPYHSSNGHVVTGIGRLFFTVSSRSRRGLKHVVDFEMRDGQPIKSIHYGLCDCENATLGHARPCRHVLAAAEALESQILRHQTKPQPRRRYRLNQDNKFTPKLKT